MQTPRLSARVIARLAQAEACESNPHYRDDLRIARLTVLYAANGEAVACSPDVLASYTVLGLHPRKVWPAMLERRVALCGPCKSDAPPKKPAQSVKLWSEKTSGARAAISRADETLLCDNTISVPMAAPSIAALYPNSDAPSSAKTRQFTLDELKRIVAYSGAAPWLRAHTLASLEARGPWPKHDGPATPIICVSQKGMMIEGGVVRRTAYRRSRRAVDLGFWRQTHKFNRWLNCPKCGAAREAATCAKCGHRGRSRNADGSTNTKEFCRPYTYEIVVEKFLTAPRPREIRSVDWRTYGEYKEAAKRGEHPNVTEMPARKPAQPTPPDPPAAAPKPEPAKPAAAKLTRREATKFVAALVHEMRGFVEDGGWPVNSADPRYRPKLPFEEALRKVCARWHTDEDFARESLKFWGYKVEGLQP